MPRKHGFQRRVPSGFPVASVSENKFSPADLRSKMILWHDPSDLATQWQEHTKTTPAALGETVGYALDKGPNGYDVNQGTAGYRPVLTMDANNRLYWRYQTNDWMEHGSAELPLTQFTLLIAIKEFTEVDNAGYFSWTPATGDDWNRTDALVLEGGTGDYQARVVGSSSADLTVSLDGEGVLPLTILEVVKTASSVSLYADGALAETDDSFTALDATSAGGFRYGCRTATGAFAAPYLNGGIYGTIMLDGTETPAERANCRSWLAGKAGSSVSSSWIDV